MSNVKTAYKISNTIFNNFISNLSIDFKKVEILDNSGDKKLGTKGPGSRLSKSSDSSSSQKNSPQTSLLPNSKEQTNTPQLSQGSSEKGNYNQKNDQGESRKTMSAPVIKPENYVTKVKGNETIGIGDIYIYSKDINNL